MRKHSAKKNNQTLFWAVSGSFTMLFLALLYQQYSQGNSSSPPLLADNVEPTSSFPRILASLQTAKDQKAMENENSLCLENLQNLKSQTWSTQEWIENFKISITEEITQEIDFQKQLKLLKRALQEILTEKSYYPNIINTKTFKLILCPQSKMDKLFGIGAFGDYDMLHDTISLVYLPKGSLQEYKQHLRNEFFGHQIIFKNILRGIQVENKFLLATPCLDDNGSLDKSKMLEFQLALKESEVRVAKLLESFHDEDANFEIDSMENKLLTLAKDYQSESCKLKGNSKSRAICLLNEILKMQKTIEQHPNYQNQPKWVQLSEKASYYAQFDDEIQVLLFPAMHSYLTRFFCQMPAPNKQEHKEDISRKDQRFSYHAEKLSVDPSEKLKWKFASNFQKQQERDQQPSKQKKAYAPHFK